MENYKIRVKVGSNEFEAEGPREAVEAQFEAWKELIKSQPISASIPDQNKPNLPSNVVEVRTRDGVFSAPWDIFGVDDKRKLVTLKAHPTGENRDADAILLILYGYLKALEQQEVLVTNLKNSLAQSGLRPERIDRAIAPYLRENLVLKTGSGKGGKYRLTNTGLTKADTLARTLFEKMAL